MSEKLVLVRKDSLVIPVHESALADHERLGFVVDPMAVEKDIHPDAFPAEEPDVQDDPEADPDADKPATIEKGPRGLFFVMQDGKRVSRGFATLEDAEASLKVEG